MDFDVVIIGGGPAGASAGHWAARSGLSTAIVDKARFPRDKTCGDGLTASALREVERIGIDVRPHSQPIRTAEITSPSGHRISMALETGLARGAIMTTVMRRADIDAELISTAVGAGAKLFEDTKVTRIGSSADGVELEVSTPSGAPIDQLALRYRRRRSAQCGSSGRLSERRSTPARRSRDPSVCRRPRE